MLFLGADFWPLFWAVIAGGAGLTALLSLFVATTGRPHRAQAPLPTDAQAPVPTELPARPAPEPARIRRAA